MRIFLIDFENVHSEGMTGVDNLTENDEVVIFYSVNADSLSFELLHKLMFCKAKLSYYKIRRGGRNALDFQLATYLGYLVKSREEAEFYVISKDNGFDFAIDFWEAGYANEAPVIRRFNNVKAALLHLTHEAKRAEQAEQAELAEMRAAEQTPEEAEEDENIIMSLLNAAKDKHDLYLSTVKRLGQKRGVEMYRRIKTRFAGGNGS